MAELLAYADRDARELWESLRLGYTETRGMPLLRKEIATLHPGLGAEHVIEVVPEEGIFLAMQALLEPGDTVVVSMPAYQSLHEIARSMGCVIREWWPEKDPEWRFDPSALEELADGAQAIVINFPHNPTGCLPTPEEFGKILDVAKSSGAWIFSDEMYRFLEHAPAATLPSAAELYPRSIALGGLSKSFALPGLRMGWLVSQDLALLDQVAGLKDYTTICGCAPGEVLALIALRIRSKILGRNCEITRRNLDAFDGWLKDNPKLFRWERPRASSVGLAELLLPETATSFCERALRESGIALAPSQLLGGDDRHIRIGFGRADFTEGLAELAHWAQLHS